MNNRKTEIERREILDLMRPFNRKQGCLKFYANETRDHKYKKFLLFIKLQEEGYEVYSEVIFNSGKRCDILGIKDGVGYGFEVLSSETIAMVYKKLVNYPEIISWSIIAKEKDIGLWFGE